jgi:hypothetical protein
VNNASNPPRAGRKRRGKQRTTVARTQPYPKRPDDVNSSRIRDSPAAESDITESSEMQSEPVLTPSPQPN